jgi:hypothetical protein
MPFYIRLRPRRPLWQPILLGAGLLLVWTSARAVFVVPALAAPRPGMLALVLYIGAFAIAGGSLAGACYWALDLAPFKRSALIRGLGGTVSVAAFLTVFALAGGQFGPKSPLARLFEPTFVISTLLVSSILGGVFAKGLLTRAETEERIYLTPAEFSALAPEDRARLRPDTAGASDPPDSTSAV